MGLPMGRPVRRPRAVPCVVLSPREDGLAVRTERHGRIGHFVHRLADRPTGGGVPEPRRVFWIPV